MTLRGLAPATSVDSQPRAKALPRELPRKPALSERKKAAREAVVRLLRSVQLSQAQLATAVELSAPVVGDVFTSDKPAHLEWLLLIDAEVAIDLVDEIRDMLRDSIRGRRVHNDQSQSTVAPSQRGRGCTAYDTQRAAFAERNKST